MPISTKEEQAIEALQGYLEHADLRETNIGLRNLIFRHVEANDGTEAWFDEFLLEMDGLFEFFDTLQFIYPSNENMSEIDRAIKS